MPEIEFIEVPAPAAPDPSSPALRLLDRMCVPWLVPAGLALAAAGLAVWAPFRWIYTITSPSEDGITFISTDPANSKNSAYNHLHLDAWGRLHVDGYGVAGSPGSRLGIVLVVGAGLLVLAGVGFGWLGLGHASTLAGRIRDSARVTLIVGASVCAAMSAAFFVEYLPVRNQFRANQSQGPSPVARQIAVAPGHAWLIAVAAAGVAVLALVSSYPIARVGRKRGDVGSNVSQPPPNLPA